jgi:putative phage-type endonuclease
MTAVLHDTGTPVAGIDPAHAVQILPPGTDRRHRRRWLAVRRLGIGGSDISTLVGLSRWSSPYELWLDKTGQLPLVDEQSEAAEMGALLEPVVRDRFARVQHVPVTPVGTLRAAARPWMLANPDGLCHGINAGYEGKTCSSFQAAEWAHGQTSDHAELQAQWGMAVTGLDTWWVAVLIGGQRNEYRRIDRDPALIADLTDIAERFWRDHVEPRVAPDPDGSDACTTAIKNRFAHARADTDAVVDDDLADDLADAKTAAADNEQVAARAHEQVKNHARLLIGDRERLVTTSGRVVATWRHINQLDMGRLTANRPDLVDDYTRPVRRDEFDTDAFQRDHPDVYAEHRQRRLHFT